jgi:hypothetical protein
VTAKVFSGLQYEKSMCYVSYDLTAYQANKFCISKKMRLYRIDSSTAALSKFSQTANIILGNSPTAVVLVAGRKDNKCLNFYGSGKFQYDKCEITSHFFCEFVEKRKFSTNLIR